MIYEQVEHLGSCSHFGCGYERIFHTCLTKSACGHKRYGNTRQSVDVLLPRFNFTPQAAADKQMQSHTS